MTDFYSATCPNCGAPVAGTLDENPDVPFYACGAFGYGRTCPAPPARSARTAPNVAALTPGDAAELLDIIESADAGLIHVQRARGR